MEEKKTSCNIIEDLLPLYCDELTSEATNVEIKDHLDQCEQCAEIYQNMSKGLLLESKANEIGRKNPFAHLKRKITLQSFLFLVIGIVLCAGIFYVAFVGTFKFHSKDISITYNATTRLDENGEREYRVDFSIAAPKGTILNQRKEWSAFGPRRDGLVLYKALKVPFDDRGEHPNEFDQGYSSNRPFTEDDTFTIICADKTRTYYLKDIGEDAGIQ